jgi:hypothetical protein
LAKIWPTGALLKNGFLKFWTGPLFSTAVWLGRLPVFLKMKAREAGEVRNLTRSAASAWCEDCLGTARNDPPQLPPVPGVAAMSHLPFVAGAWPWM